MTKQNHIESQLESDRVAELSELLTKLQPKLLEYIQSSDLHSHSYRSDGLGKYHEPAELKKIFFQEDLDVGIKGNTDQVFEVIDKVLKYSVNTWHPGFLDKLFASNNPIGVVSDLILSVLNTNSHVYTVSPVLSIIENHIGHKYANLFFHNAQCGGLTFSGGSWSNITSMQMARALRYPGTKDNGNDGYKFAIYTSEHCHYSVEKAAILLGLGSKHVFKVSTHVDGTMDVDELAKVISETKDQGYTPLYINATAGTTVFGSFDDFTAIASVAKHHGCHFHIDGSWGGNVIFSSKHKVKMTGAELADSITVNPHKMLGVPTTCSFLLVPRVSDFQKSMSLNAPYLFHGREGTDAENFDLADGTMGCGRRADSFKFYMAWLYYGHQGFGERVDHAFAIGQDFVEKIGGDSRFELVVPGVPQCLQVCFYYKIDGISNTEVTRYVSRELHRQGRFLVDFSPMPASKKVRGEDKGEFFRVVFNSPILTDKVVDDLIAGIHECGAALQRSR